MAAVFKKNKAKIEAYFAKQDLAAIIAELQLEHLISKPEEQEINSTVLNKRAHTLTKILESKIVNNPDVFQDLKQVLGSFKFEEDTDESSQPEPSTMTVISPAGETRIQIAPSESKPGNSTSEDGVYTYRRHYRNEPSSAASLTQGSGAKAKPTSVPKAKPSDSLIQSRSKRTKKQKSQHHQSNHSEDFLRLSFLLTSRTQ